MICTPFSCGVPMGTGVGADAGASSSPFTVDGLLLLLLFCAGEVLALGPLELVPCWLACSCIMGAAICPGIGLPTICGEPGSIELAMAGLAPTWNWPNPGVRGPPCGMGWPFMPCCGGALI